MLTTILGARRLLTYKRVPNSVALDGYVAVREPKKGGTANELNRFRQKVNTARVHDSAPLTVCSILPDSSRRILVLWSHEEQIFRNTAS